MDLTDQQKPRIATEEEIVAMAKKVAASFYAQMGAAQLPVAAQLEAVSILTRALFIANVPRGLRVKLLNKTISYLRAEITASVRASSEKGKRSGKS